jgi:hypothetical protein
MDPGEGDGGTWKRFSESGLEEIYPYPLLDECYEKVRADGVIRGRTVLAAMGIGGDGRGCDREHVRAAAELILMRRRSITCTSPFADFADRGENSCNIDCDLISPIFARKRPL